MAANSCVNGTLDGANYSNPVPVIGLYIAAGTMVCFSFMLYDIISGVRHRQSWLPCWLFSLNSVTLTLASIATKITVDLTTAMPGVHDQLSKLTGTVLICIYMGFVCPSVAKSRESEMISNMAALSIMVITVVVNICIQIATGVIHLFIPEHIIIICCILMILLLLWFWALDFRNEIGDSEDHKCKSYIGNGFSKSNMLQEITLYYKSAYIGNPQLRTCWRLNHSTIAGFCLISFAVLIQAAIRGLVLKQLKFCGGRSDYDWSMWAIVITQILTIGLGCLATTTRWFTLFSKVEFEFTDPAFKFSPDNYGESKIHILIRTTSFLGTPGRKFVIHFLNCARYIAIWASMLIMVPAATIFKAFGGLFTSRFLRDGWGYRKADNNISRWKDEARKREPSKHLSLILSRTPRSEHLNARSFEGLKCPDEAGIDTSHLQIVILVRLACFCLPNEMTKSLTRSLEEVFEILDYVDSRIRTNSHWKKFSSKLAKAVYGGNGYHSYLSTISKDKKYQSLSPLDRAVFLCKHVTTNDYRFDEHVIMYILNRKFETVDDLYQCIEQTYVDMLHLYLAQLPNAIHKDLVGSPVEECQDRARRALQMFLSIQPLEVQIEWLYPDESGITSFPTPPSPILSQDEAPVEEAGSNFITSLEAQGVSADTIAAYGNHITSVTDVEYMGTTIKEITIDCR